MKKWLVAVGCSIGLSVGFGPVFVYGFGLFQKPMIAELGWNRAQFSLGFSLATLLTAMLNYYVGGVIDRHGARVVAIAGVLILPVALLGFSLVHTYPAFLLAALGMGVAGATSSYPTYIPLLPPWFESRLGLAFSIAASGVGYGASLMSLAISHFIQDLGWRHAFDVLAVALLLIGVLNSLILVRDKPRVEPRPGISAPEEPGIETPGFLRVARSQRYWRLVAAFAIVPLVGIGINFHLAALLTDRGFSGPAAGGVIAVTGVAIVAARLGTGALLDYVSSRLVGVLLFGGQALSVLLLASGLGGPVPYVAAALLGFASGGEGDLMPFVLSRQFGRAAYGRIYGTCFAFFNVGTLVGPLLMGLGFETFRSYSQVLAGFACLSMAAAVLLYFAVDGSGSPPRYGRKAICGR